MDQTRLDPATEQALKSLADIAMPAPVSWIPQTWGWAMLAIIILGLIAVACWRWMKRRRADRYRREALAILSKLEKDIGRHPGMDQAVVEAVPALLKRVALAAWPREEVAASSGQEWVTFLVETLPAGKLDPDLARVLIELEYRDVAIAPEQTAKLIATAKHWIEGHHVSA